VDRAGQERLARAALAAQQHRGARVGDGLDQRQHAAHALVARLQGSQAVGALERGAQLAVLALEGAVLARAGQVHEQALGRHGPGDVVEGPAAHGLDGVGDRSEPGQQDHRRAALELLGQAHQLHPGGVGVGQHRRPGRAREGRAGTGRVGALDLAPGLDQRGLERLGFPPVG
jgi:hypothetical protein